MSKKIREHTSLAFQCIKTNREIDHLTVFTSNWFL